MKELPVAAVAAAGEAGEEDLLVARRTASRRSRGSRPCPGRRTPCACRRRRRGPPWPYMGYLAGSSAFVFVSVIGATTIAAREPRALRRRRRSRGSCSRPRRRRRRRDRSCPSASPSAATRRRAGRGWGCRSGRALLGRLDQRGRRTSRGRRLGIGGAQRPARSRAASSWRLPLRAATMPFWALPIRGLLGSHRRAATRAAVARRASFGSP